MGEQVAAGLQFKVKGRKGPLNGGVAQLGEHLPCKQGVKGSNPSISIVPTMHFAAKLLSRVQARHTDKSASAYESKHSTPCQICLCIVP